MNNEKLILNALDWLIWNTDAKDEMQQNIKGSIGQEIDKVLNPIKDKEDCCDMEEDANNSKQGCGKVFDVTPNSSMVCGETGVLCEECVKDSVGEKGQ